MNARRLAWMYMALAGNLLYSGLGWADSWQHSVTSRMSTAFDTNPNMSSTNSSGTWIGLFEPGYAISGNAGEGELSAGLAFQLARSSDKIQVPDRDSPSVFLNWLRPTESGEFGISSRYAQVATRDAGGTDATGRVNAASTRDSRTLSGNWRREMSERYSLSADGAYERNSYKGGNYINYSTRTAGVKFSRVSSEQITTFLRVSGNKYVPASGDLSSSLVDASLGLIWKVENLDWTMQMGKSRASGADSGGAQGSVETLYTGQRTQMTLFAGRTVTPSGLGGFVKADHLRWGGNYALSEYTNTGIDLSWQRNISSAITGGGTSSSSSIWVDHNLTSLWGMRTYYMHRTFHGVGVAGATSNLLGLALTYNNINF